MRNLVCGLVILVLLGLAGCGGGGQARQAVEDEVAARAPELLGPAERYRTEVRGIGPDAVEMIRITGLAVRPNPDLVLDPLTLTLERVQYAGPPFRVEVAGGSRFEARVSDAAVNHYLRQQGRTASGYLKNIRVEFRRHEMAVTAAAAVMNLDVPIATTGRLQVVDGMRLHYDVESLRVLGVGVPAAVQGLLTKIINPVIDLSGLRFTPEITRLTFEPGAVIIGGRAILRDVN